ncbi:unnamed protein product [Calypogeia fissa]
MQGDGTFVDVTFEVDGETFQAHKLALAARSPVFKAQLYGLMRDRNSGKIIVKDMEAPSFYSCPGNAMVHAIQVLIKSTDQADLGLTLDLHCNKLGAGALLEICRCPVWLSRLEVLNLSGNRLMDAVARHFSKILKESQGLVWCNLKGPFGTVYKLVFCGLHVGIL